LKFWLATKVALKAAGMVLRGSIAPFDRLSGEILGGGMANGQPLKEPYRNSVWVQRAIKKVAGPIAAVKLEFYGDARGGEQLVSDPKLAAFWNAPAIGSKSAGGKVKRLSLNDTIEATVGWLKLAGEAFWLMESSAVPFPEVDAMGGLRPFVIARPDRMRAIVNRGTGELEQWEFTDGAGRRVLLEPERVIQFKCWNPYSEYRGLAEYESARIAAEADYLAGKFNLNLMRNNGDTGPIIIGKNGIPDELQQQQIIGLLREKKEMSLRGEYRAVFLGGDITVEDPQVKTPDGDFVSIRTQNRYEIFQAFGVPPSMADKMESYSVGSASDWYMLITETCIPTAVKMSEGIEEFMNASGRALFAAFQWSQHPVMQAVRREQIDNGTKLFDRGVPWKTASEYLDLGLPEFNGWETGYLPFSVTPVGSDGLPMAPEPVEDEELGETTEDTEDTEDTENGPVKEMVRALRGERGEGRGEKGCNCGGKFATGTGLIFQKARDKREVAQWSTLMAMRRASVKAAQAKFNKVLFAARGEVLARIESAQGRIALAMGATTRAAAADFIFDLKKFKERLLVEMRSAALDTLQKAGNELFKEVGKDDPWKLSDPVAQQFFKGRQNKLTDVADEVFATVKEELQEGIDAGESTKELADRVRGQFNDMSKERAMRIAATETQAAYGTARQVAMRDAGVQFKKWLTSGNANVRPAHQAANQQVVRIDEAFEVGGEQLMHPGDPAGSAENVINCHCVSVAVAEQAEPAPTEEE
jgi:SPP1 gp7 family putative phage head morphogenesis protein